jgi:acetyltransferase-like isoleucine patch superfamily enzyme
MPSWSWRRLRGARTAQGWHYDLAPMSLLKSIGFLLYPRPFGIGALGRRSVVMLPRRVQGAAHVHIGADVVVQPNAWIAAFDRWGDTVYTPRISIGDHVRIGTGAMITAVEEVRIGEGCLLSEHVFMSDHAHQAIPGPVPPTRQPLSRRGPVVIGRHCFIGIRACIMGGVTLGDYCVVGANSVVTHSFPAGSVVAGAPARLLKSLPVPQP